MLKAWERHKAWEDGTGVHLSFVPLLRTKGSPRVVSTDQPGSRVTRYNSRQARDKPTDSSHVLLQSNWADSTHLPSNQRTPKKAALTATAHSQGREAKRTVLSRTVRGYMENKTDTGHQPLTQWSLWRICPKKINSEKETVERNVHLSDIYNSKTEDESNTPRHSKH